MRLTRATMSIPIWIKSEYVTYIGIALLLSSGGFAPPKMEGRPPLCVLTFRIASITHSSQFLNHIILFSLSVLAKYRPSRLKLSNKTLQASRMSTGRLNGICTGQCRITALFAPYRLSGGSHAYEPLIKNEAVRKIFKTSCVPLPDVLY